MPTIHKADQSDWLILKQWILIISRDPSRTGGQIKGDWSLDIKRAINEPLTVRSSASTTSWTARYKDDRVLQQQSLLQLDQQQQQWWREAAAECRTSAWIGSCPPSWHPATPRKLCTLSGLGRSRCCRCLCWPAGGAAATRRCSVPTREGSTAFTRTRARTCGWWAGRNLQVRDHVVVCSAQDRWQHFGEDRFNPAWCQWE